MTINITTWGPDTCQCEFSYTTDDKDPEGQSVFYAVHNVCQVHAHLATKAEHLAKSADKDLHATKGQVKMRHIHTAMQRNVEQHQKAMANAKRRTQRQELEQLEPTIHQHNARVKANFEDIFDEPFAHDEHIYATVLAENQLKNRAIGHLEEQHKIASDKVLWHHEGPNRRLVLTFPHEDHAAVSKSLDAKFGKDKIAVNDL